jgi:hypothetical protein
MTTNRPWQVRAWGEMFYVVISCTARSCEMTWKSQYFQKREQAEAYGEKVPERPRCLAHTKKKDPAE